MSEIAKENSMDRMNMVTEAGLANTPLVSGICPSAARHSVLASLLMPSNDNNISHYDCPTAEGMVFDGLATNAFLRLARWMAGISYKMSEQK
ncbi:hypothetical protein N9W44_03800 [Alphaproteobacteria bacterium]|jgi:hypothetical protein|nr:hypothetical protein [Alphaproteobacteria bacterium]